MNETTGLKADIDQLPALVPSLQTHDEEENERVPKKSTERKQALKTRDERQRTDHFTKKKSSSFGSFIPNLKVVVQLE